MQQPLTAKEVRAYAFLTSLVICGLAGSIITATKIIYVGINFPFSNIVFSILTYPIVNVICEIWGKQAAKQAVWLGLGSQVILTIIIQLSIIVPHSPFWHHESAYQMVLSTNLVAVMAGLAAFAVSQMFNIVVYQRLKELCEGKFLWLRSNFATYLGQAIDSSIFVLIVFASSSQKYNVLFGSILVKIIITFLMTPIIYFIVNGVNRYLESTTMAFKNETETNGLEPIEGI
jgi:queuosine precursor transporter